MKTRKAGITIVGLGPGDESLLTLEADRWLKQVDEIYVRTENHPVVTSLAETLVIHSFDPIYDVSENFTDVYASITAEVIKLGERPQGVTYAVPGHPFVAEATTPEIIRQAGKLGIPIRVIDGLSFIEPVCRLLGLDPLPQLTLLDALELGARQFPPVSPASPLLVVQIYSRMIASEVKLTLANIYGDEHPVRLVHDAGTPEEQVQEIMLYEIDRQTKIGLRTALYVPPLAADTSLEAFQEIVAKLRAPDGCPWDREQTHQSLKKYLLEESYELLDALEQEDPDKIAEELGDLLLQILLHTQIGMEEGEFGMTDVLSGIYRKIVRRHPHVFGDVVVENAAGVVATWEEIKARERQEKNSGGQAGGMLAGVPRALPALSQAQEIQERAARVGFDWDNIAPVLAKVEEEYDEVRQAAGAEEKNAEIGDLLFAVVNLARWLDVDAESALRGTGDRFRRRFQYIEDQAAIKGINLSDMSLAEMDVFWDEAKRQE